MTIRVRLIISYIAMLVIPVVLSAIAFSLIIDGMVHEKEGNLFHDVSPEKRAVQQGAGIFTEIKTIADTEPERLENTAELRDLNRKLALVNTGLVVRKNGAIVYASPSLAGKEVIQRLPGFGGERHEDHDPHLIDSKLYLTKQHDFYFANAQEGSVYLITDLSPVGETARYIIIAMAAAVFLILVLTNGILTFIVSRSIVKPLEGLKNAAEQIREGNLDCRIEYKRKDEIGRLAAAFEEMRSQLKKSVQIQERYENNRKELISSISHDLKTPITAIKGYVEGIIDGVPDSREKMDRYIRTISVKADDLDKMIDELFLFSKLDLKRLPFNFEEVAVLDFFHDCMEELQFEMEKKNITLYLTAGFQGPVQVMADREKLKRVLINIFENAAKYMNKEKGRVETALDLDGDFVTVKIADNGKGISAKDLPYVFDSFFRGDPSRNQSAGGSGLGLAIAKRIIEEHGGKIWMESAENEGTTIFFTLRRV